MVLGKFSEVLTQRCELDCNRPVVAGISGGPDSLCLLDLLLQNNLRVIVGHVNHLLRPEAAQEADFVAQYCSFRSVDYVVAELNVAQTAEKFHLSVEEAGRKLRYEFLFELAMKENAQAVLVAHTSDDQVETILMHMLRGSGLAGLRGMDVRQERNAWSKSIPLVRPLLFFSRAEVLDYCQERGLTPIIDKSNDEITFFRNRIRKELIPLLTTYNPQIKERLISMGDVVKIEDDFVSQELVRAWADAIVEESDHYIHFSRDKVAKLHPAILRRLVKQSIQQLDPKTRNISHETIIQATQFLLQSPPGDRIDLPGNLELFKYLKKSIILCNISETLDDLWPQVRQTMPLEGITKDGLPLNGDWKLYLSDDLIMDRADPWRCWLDAEKLQNLSLSKFQPGDKFVPLGMNGKTQKLGDYWTNQGLPVRARENWPLIRSGNEIAWIPGFRVSEETKVTTKTRKILSLQLKKEN